jgi:hypothetical protein
MNKGMVENLTADYERWSKINEKMDRLLEAVSLLERHARELMRQHDELLALEQQRSQQRLL